MTGSLLDTKFTPWTAEDWQLLPDDGRRYEIVDGSLIVAPPPNIWHQGIAGAICAALRRQLPMDLLVQENTGVRLGRSVRIPDLVVFHSAAFWRPEGVLQPADVVLAVEVESPSSVRADRIGRPAQLAAHGIPHYWRVEAAGGPAVHVHRLAGDTYEQVAVARGEGELAVGEPFGVRLVPARLLPRRP
jgi:Uma2 family endonuclease